MRTLEAIIGEFHEAAVSPRKQMQKYLDGGEQVILCAPVYTPEELVHAMGLVPFGTWGGDVEINRAKEYFPAFICSVMQSILELGMKGTYDGASAIMIPPLCDSLKTLGENWKYGVKEIPFIPAVYPQNRKPEYGKQFAKESYYKVIASLTEITGREFNEAALLDSIKIYNRHNKVMREVSACLDSYPQITAVSRGDIFKSAWFMKKEEHTALTEELLAVLKNTPAIKEGRKKVITTGILADNPALLSILDDNQIQIAGDDIAHESRQYRTDAPESAEGLQALAEKFAARECCSVLYDPERKRAAYLADLVRERKADGLILFMTKFCDPEEFDYVEIKREMEQQEIPMLTVEIDRQMDNFGQAKTMIEAFADML